MATPIPSNTVSFTLDEVAAATRGVTRARVTTATRGVVIDSRAVKSGSLFVALRGETHDAHAFLSTAKEKGAAILLTERGNAFPQGVSVVEVDDTLFALGELARFHRERWGGRIVGVTGSAGKTTTKELCAAALSSAGARVVATLGNLNNRIGVPMTLFTLDASVDTAVIEMGTSERGEIARLGAIVRPDVAIVTLASVAHTAGLGSLADVVKEKSSLWSSLRADGTAIGNADDVPTAARLDSRAANTKAWTFGCAESADVRLVSRQVNDSGMSECVFSVHGERVEGALSILGRAAALDASAAIAACVALLGPASAAAAAAGLSKASSPAGRVTPVHGLMSTLVLDDTYNANPVSTRAAIETLVEMAAQRSARAVAILGDMKELGADAAAKHEEVGNAVVEAGVSVFIGCGREMAQATAAAVRASAGRYAKHPTQVMHVVETLDAVELAKKIIAPKDVILIKGSRSMGMERIVDALRAPAGGRA
ncbi:MAG: UDP-N-acetylmuramoyl-tripeptide--D-alanyl-D-alanine ligase [Sandaracinaceae bacterium]|nr:UDP-N-acetylmuramoyl-tripeptide--D-alanyl-D-alanine ligase [Sandaracinaceae bacterium]